MKQDLESSLKDRVILLKNNVDSIMKRELDSSLNVRAVLAEERLERLLQNEHDSQRKRDFVWQAFLSRVVETITSRVLIS